LRPNTGVAEDKLFEPKCWHLHLTVVFGNVVVGKEDVVKLEMRAVVGRAV
jgi:hypothetical protein